LSDQNYGTLPDKTAGENAKRNLDTALQLDPENAEALAGMGLYLSNHELDHENAMDVLQQAVAINPNMVNANNWLAMEMEAAGELRSSLKLREQSFKRDPLHPPTFGNLQGQYSVLGQTEKALEMLDGLQAYLPGDANLLSHYAQVNLMTGQLAEARRQYQLSYEKEPLDSINRFWFGFTLLLSRRYEEMTEMAPDRLATLALSRLGRTEEALIRGNTATGNGQNPTWYFQALVENGRFAELVNVLESRWPSLEDFETNWPGRNGYGYRAMGCIAEAYRNVGNETKFNDAMLRFKVSLDAQLAEGAENWPMSFSQAYFAMLANDNDAAITFLEKAFQQGGYLDTENETAWPIFKALNGDPRYEAAKAGMLTRWNTELEKMKLEELTIGETS